jgi:hypothetical protein
VRKFLGETANLWGTPIAFFSGRATEDGPVDLETYLRHLCPAQGQRVSLQAYVSNDGSGITLAFMPQADGKEVCFTVEGDAVSPSEIAALTKNVKAATAALKESITPRP